MTKRRGIKDTPGNREILLDLGCSFVECKKRQRIFVKVPDKDFDIIKELLSEDQSTNKG